MCKVVFDVPNEVLFSIHMNQQEINSYARRILAMELYKNQHVSVGYCSEIADMSEESFIKYLGANKISIFHFDNDEELEEELRVAESHC